MGVIGLYAIVQMAFGAFDHKANELRQVSTFIGLIISLLMLIFSVIFPGKDIVEIRPATNNRIGNELVIQADGYPTQISKSIELIDKEVQIKKISKRNVWGGGLSNSYEVEIVKKEK